MANIAAEIRIRAERRAGELLAEMSLSAGNPQWSQYATKAKLSDLGIDKHESSRWQKVAAVPADDFERYIEQTKSEANDTPSA